MFNKLTDLGFVRSRKEAFGFYLAYLFLVIVVAVVASEIVAVLINSTTGGFSSGFSQGARIGTALAAIQCLALSFLILSAKKSMSFGLILLSLLAGLLALLGGGLLGVIIPAYFTTLPSLSSSTIPPSSTMIE